MIKNVLYENFIELIIHYSKICYFSYNVFSSLFRNEQKASQSIMIPTACYMINSYEI